MSPIRSREIPAALPVCLQCGVRSTSVQATFCRRCGLPFGTAPRPYMAPSCPICYREAGSDGRFDSLLGRRERVDLVRHQEEHALVPVGDDEYLESLREGDDVRIGRWRVPFDLLRRYLVIGVIDAQRSRRALHDALLVAMSQMARWGDGAVIADDRPEWAEARAALTALMERYHRVPSGLRPTA